MTIYATAFNTENKSMDGHSADSGFKTLNEVLSTMGDDYIKETKRMIIYTGIVFSDFPFWQG